MPLAKRHAEAIEKLGAEHFKHLSKRVSDALGRKLPFRTRQQLIKLCDAPTVHPKDLQMTLARETDELGMAVLEALVGHKIVRGATITPKQFKPIKPRKVKRVRTEAKGGSVVAAKGDMVIRLLVTENPKRAGGAAHDRFAKYRDKMLVSDALAKGLRASDLRYDQKHEFIKLEEAA